MVARIQALTLQIASPGPVFCFPASASRQSGISMLPVVFSWSRWATVSGPTCAELSCLCPLMWTWATSQRRECRLPTGYGFLRGTWLEVMLGHLQAGSLEALGVSSGHLGACALPGGPQSLQRAQMGLQTMRSEPS